jgi:hypothetical protein
VQLGVTVPTQNQNIFFTDTIANGHAQPAYCGPRNYVLSPNTYPFVWLNGDKVEYQTDDPTWIGGPYSFTITATLANYPMIASHTESFKIKVTCGC